MYNNKHLYIIVTYTRIYKLNNKILSDDKCIFINFNKSSCEMFKYGK